MPHAKHGPTRSYEPFRLASHFLKHSIPTHATLCSVQVMLLAADAAQQALGCASWEEAVSVTTLASVVHRRHGHGVVLPAGTPTHWLVLRGEALLALGQRSEACIALGSAFDDGLMRGCNVGRKSGSNKSLPRKFSSVLSLFRRHPSESRNSGDLRTTTTVAERGAHRSSRFAEGRRHTESDGSDNVIAGGERHTDGGGPSSRPPPARGGADALSMGEARSMRRPHEVLSGGGFTLTSEAEVKHALRAFAMLFFAQLETAADSDGDAAAAIVTSMPISSRLPLAFHAATLLPDGSERMLGLACILISSGLSARQNAAAPFVGGSTPGRRGGNGATFARNKLLAMHDAIDCFVEMSPVATKLSRSLGDALAPPAGYLPGGVPLLLSRTMETSSMEMSAPSFLAMLCLALGLSPVATEPTAALWLRRASALALEAEHGQLHRTICMLSVDVPLAGTI